MVTDLTVSDGNGQRVMVQAGQVLSHVKPVPVLFVCTMSPLASALHRQVAVDTKYQRTSNVYII